MRLHVHYTGSFDTLQSSRGSRAFTLLRSKSILCIEGVQVLQISRKSVNEAVISYSHVYRTKVALALSKHGTKPS